MDTMTPTTPHSPIKAAPIPLISGDTFEGPDGQERHATTATVTLTADDGTQTTLDLEYRFGGWWAPANA